jgi:regulatory protein
MTRRRRPDTSDSINSLKGNYRKAYNTALRLLTRRDHSKYELVQKLKQRNFEDGEIKKVLLECERLDYLNDERTAQVFIGQLLRKGYGAKRIRHELNRKGLTSKRISGLLTETLSEAVERVNAERILIKHIKKFERENDGKKRKDKIYRFLYSRGFSNQVIAELLKKY